MTEYDAKQNRDAPLLYTVHSETSSLLGLL